MKYALKMILKKSITEPASEYEVRFGVQAGTITKRAGLEWITKGAGFEWINQQ